MDLPKTLGTNVRRLREGLGASQGEIAFRADMNRAYLSDVERGARNPTVRVVGRLATALGIEPAKLFQLAPERPTRRTGWK